jgi:hypothetical protein
MGEIRLETDCEATFALLLVLVDSSLLGGAVLGGRYMEAERSSKSVDMCLNVYGYN